MKFVTHKKAVTGSDSSVDITMRGRVSAAFFCFKRSPINSIASHAGLMPLLPPLSICQNPYLTDIRLTVLLSDCDRKLI